MIVKKREMPVIIQMLEALLRRLPKNHPKREKIIDDLMKRMAGYNGEKRLDYYLSFLDEKEFKIFQDLRLASGKYYFQIDTILITTKFALILECKNWAGTIYFDQTFHQVLRTNNEKEEGFQDPLSQAEHQCRQLKGWLNAHGFPPVPIEYAVVISHSSTIIKTSPGQSQIFNKVCHAHRLLNKIDSLEKFYQADYLNVKEIGKISRTFLKKHVPLEINILKKYDIEPTEILSGVPCPKCSDLPMIYEWGKWHCSSCKISSATAHIQAVHDYFLLIKPKITNSDFRSFLQISSIHSAARLLSSMKLPYTGNKRYRVYEKPQV
ncbi:NERD domain-containing protein [Bacillus sp. FJAT-29790]|uniref:nuclease-related domain-containing protein n=1 Tax=Bacillus sp. FJAT-29790 TaxID=1895002 RepID=UPI001C24FCF0|nr:nuclease-related domain-containing protein [Bacillus sp. FJAT-29790]MBU8878308.1 NERD domain-containing protein [Bacillus sp. FJAT-29790]